MVWYEKMVHGYWLITAVVKPNTLNIRTQTRIKDITQQGRPYLFLRMEKGGEIKAHAPVNGTKMSTQTPHTPPIKFI